jgi:hypothetical protein
MYALDFDATVKANQNGFIWIDDDDKVRSSYFHSDDEKDQGIKSKYVNIGDTFVINNKVIMVKRESGWEPVDMRFDLY